MSDPRTWGDHVDSTMTGRYLILHGRLYRDEGLAWGVVGSSDDRARAERRAKRLVERNPGTEARIVERDEVA